VRLLDDKVAFVESLQAAGITETIPTHCFSSKRAALDFCAHTQTSGHAEVAGAGAGTGPSAVAGLHVLKGARSCDSMDVAFGTKRVLHDILLRCKTAAFDRCVIQPDVFPRCTRRGGALVEWRVYVVHVAGRFRLVDMCRVCLCTKAASV